MIARIVIPLILVIVGSDLYIDVHYFRRRYSLSWWLRLLWWLPCIALSVYTISLASYTDFVPTNLTWLNTYLLLLGLFVGPKAVFALCSGIGSAIMRLAGYKRINYGHFVGIILGFGAVLAYIYGLTVGIKQIKVNHVTLCFKNLPPTFDGYKILQISDLHVGSFYGWRQKILQAEMDSVRKQHADLIVFTGDLQNMRPDEIAPQAQILREATYGAVSVLGNHDDGHYVAGDMETQRRLLDQLVDAEKNELGWRLLRNEHLVVRQGRDSIIIAGMEDEGEPPLPNRADIRKTMRGVHPGSFIVMLQHDPSAWKRDILPHSTVQLTLSGHTHGGQIQIFGHRPTEWKGHPDKGLYEQQGRFLYVNAGLGGLVSFRLNMPNEITVITLKSENYPKNSVKAAIKPSKQ